MARGIESEKDLEDAAVRWARARGWFTRKYRTVGRRSAPDRLFIRNGVVLFVEFKRAGAQPTELQRIEIAAMRAAGALVVWLDDLADLQAVLSAHEGSKWGQ